MSKGGREGKMCAFLLAVGSDSSFHVCFEGWGNHNVLRLMG